LEYALQWVQRNGGAPGIDGQTIGSITVKPENRQPWLEQLQRELQTKTYRPSPVRRVYIPKPDGGQRPLGIPTVKDRVVQMVALLVLAPIFEADFHPNSFGFRPQRNAHQALDAIIQALRQGKLEVVDADLSKYFDKVGHDHLEKFVRHRIGDERLVRLIQKWLKAGVIEDGQWFETKEGTPQGAVISPVLANLYLHYVLDLWVKAWRKKEAHGDVNVVRYADDAVLGFQHREEAEKFLEDLRERVRKFGLELHPAKTV
jgi:RNA-directed DNA polymerase